MKKSGALEKKKNDKFCFFQKIMQIYQNYENN